MDMKDWLGVAGFFLGLGNAGWQVHLYRDKKRREQEQDQREAERDRKNAKAKLETKYLEIFRHHLGLGTWKAKAFEAHDAGLTPEEVVALLEQVWVPYHKNPVETQDKILDPMLVELRAREAKGLVKKTSG